MSISDIKASFGNEELTAVSRVIRSGIASGYRAGTSEGTYVKRLEEAISEYFRVKHAIALHSGTCGLHTALLACGIGEGDEVITTPFTFSATGTSILMAGATPVFADIEPEYFCNAPQPMREAVTDKTRGVILVHLMGQPAWLSELMALADSKSLVVIEDCAQAMCAKYRGQYVGTFGKCGVFSFNQSKVVTCGEGGALITDDDEVAEKARLIVNHGENVSNVLGYNYRMTELQAAVAYEQFKKIDYLVARRQENAQALTKELSDVVETPPVRNGCTHTFYTYAIKYHGDREWFRRELISAWIFWGNENYGKPLYRLPVFSKYEANCPVAERLWKDEIMVTDIVRYPNTPYDMKIIAKRFKEVYHRLE